MKANFISDLRIYLLFTIILFGGFKAHSQLTNCAPPNRMYLTNLTSSNLDIIWNTVQGAIDYRVSVTSNGTLISNQYPTDTLLNITSSFMAGDVIEVKIATGCMGGQYSDDLISGTGVGGILATVDIILLTEGMPCNGCRYAKCEQDSNDGNSQAEYFVYYECGCGCPFSESNLACGQVLAFSENLCNDRDGIKKSVITSGHVHDFSEEEFLKKKAAIQEYSFKVFPNPSATTSTISFYLMEEKSVHLSVFDQFGREVKTYLDKEVLQNGFHEFLINKDEFIAGMYYAILMTDHTQLITKFVRIE